MSASNGFYYSRKYYDDIYEYRHVIMPDEILKKFKINQLLSEAEWRGLGIQMSSGWQHYDFHRPEPNILLFRRPHDGAIPDEFKV
ncbi:Cyclin-dependent kinases regulatory subunit [Spironucleus salmonicida]|uniref:Cyclin-dependent kinases regulatory subunit n=1 Tax=Spironucleus salmonicida TaxID=348837 RepID=V6LLL1_9EUKA|nr:Cyclin-dependent kinases regulatory subunit [Spironucleus salmonicida]|eukprot:EST41589.1 Cyclin-dependent kinases regulatory subunit [Spironucleus salmonicida]